MKGGKKG
jgi:hypothetical protein